MTRADVDPRNSAWPAYCWEGERTSKNGMNGSLFSITGPLGSRMEKEWFALKMAIDLPDYAERMAAQQEGSEDEEGENEAEEEA